MEIGLAPGHAVRETDAPEGRGAPLGGRGVPLDQGRGEARAHVVEQEVGVGVDRLVPELGVGVVRRGLEGGNVAAGAADGVEEGLTGEVGRVGDVAARAHAEERDVGVELLELGVGDLHAARAAVGLRGAAVGVGHDRGHHAHVAVQSSGDLEAHGGLRGLPAEAADAEVGGLHVGHEAHAAGDAVAVGVVRVGEGLDVRLHDRLEQAHTDELRGDARAEVIRGGADEGVLRTAEGADRDPAGVDHLALGRAGGRARLELGSQLRVRVARGVTDHHEVALERLPGGRGHGAAVAVVARDAGARHVAGAELSGEGAEGRVGRRLVVGAIAEVGVVDPAAEDEVLTVDGREVARHLHEAVVGLVRVLVRQGRSSAAPGDRREGVGVLALGAVLTEDAARLPRDHALSDDVEDRRSVVVAPAVRHRVEELAQLELEAVAHLERAALLRVEADRARVVLDVRAGHVEAGHAGHDPVVEVLRDRVQPSIEEAELGLDRAQSPLGGDVEGDRVPAATDGVDDLDRRGPVLPVEGEVVVVALELVLARVAVACAVGEARDQRARRVLLELGLERRPGAEERRVGGRRVGDDVPEAAEAVTGRGARAGVPGEEVERAALEGRLERAVRAGDSREARNPGGLAVVHDHGRPRVGARADAAARARREEVLVGDVERVARRGAVGAADEPTAGVADLGAFDDDRAAGGVHLRAGRRVRALVSRVVDPVAVAVHRPATPDLHLPDRIAPEVALAPDLAVHPHVAVHAVEVDRVGAVAEEPAGPHRERRPGGAVERALDQVGVGVRGLPVDDGSIQVARRAEVEREGAGVDAVHGLPARREISVDGEHRGVPGHRGGIRRRRRQEHRDLDRRPPGLVGQRDPLSTGALDQRDGRCERPAGDRERVRGAACGLVGRRHRSHQGIQIADARRSARVSSQPTIRDRRRLRDAFAICNGSPLRRVVSFFRS